jgi:hypothetical protein
MFSTPPRSPANQAVVHVYSTPDVSEKEPDRCCTSVVRNSRRHKVINGRVYVAREIVFTTMPFPDVSSTSLIFDK